MRLPRCATLLLLCVATSNPTHAETCPTSASLSLKSAGCGKQHAAGFHQDTATHRICSGDRNRTYAVNVPNDYNTKSNTPWPLIVDYHGNGGTPDGQYNNSRFYNYPAGQEYLAVYPAGVEQHWQGPSYAIAGVDDLQFTTDLLNHLSQEYCIDPSRIYASGKSNGGGFVDTLACSDHGDAFAAFAMAAAALYTDTSESGCPKQRAILESHGDLDGTIPYLPTEPKTGGALPNITQWVEWWGQRDCCNPIHDRRETGDLGGYNVTSYSCNGYINVVQHYQVFELGHCWPDSSGLNTDSRRSTCSDHVLDFTPVVLDFYSKWNLSNAPQTQC